MLAADPCFLLLLESLKNNYGDHFAGHIGAGTNDALPTNWVINYGMSTCRARSLALAQSFTLQFLACTFAHFTEPSLARAMSNRPTRTSALIGKSNIGRTRERGNANSLPFAAANLDRGPENSADTSCFLRSRMRGGCRYIIGLRHLLCAGMSAWFFVASCFLNAPARSTTTFLHSLAVSMLRWSASVRCLLGSYVDLATFDLYIICFIDLITFCCLIDSQW